MGRANVIINFVKINHKAQMKINLTFFGKFRSLAENKPIEIQDETSLQSLINELKTIYPEIKNEDFLMMVNETFQNPKTVLNDGDKVSVISVVDGG